MDCTQTITRYDGYPPTITHDNKYFNYNNGYLRNQFYQVYCRKTNKYCGYFKCFNADEALFMALDHINEDYRAQYLALPTEYHLELVNNKNYHKYQIQRKGENFIVIEY